MEYRKLGNTNIEVSVICLGTMTWGQQNTEEEGVFLSDAAMQKLEEDKGGTRRRRLQSGEKSHALAVPPYPLEII